MIAFLFADGVYSSWWLSWLVLKLLSFRIVHRFIGRSCKLDAYSYDGVNFPHHDSMLPCLSLLRKGRV